jgi:hypothetical protein
VGNSIGRGRLLRFLISFLIIGVTQVIYNSWGMSLGSKVDRLKTLEIVMNFL